MASKTLAERGTGEPLGKSLVIHADVKCMLAAWEVYRKNEASLPWDMVAINPPYVSFWCLTFGANVMLNERRPRCRVPMTDLRPKLARSRQA